MLWCLLRLGDCLLCHGSGEVFTKLFPFSSTLCGTEVVASDILVGAQPRIRCWARARSSSSELVDTATARRQQRVEDATRVGLQFPFLRERRGRGAPSVAMKWRDAVKASIKPKSLSMRRIGGNRNATVTTSGLHGASAAEAQVRHVC